MNVNQGYNDLKIKSYKYEWTIKKFATHAKLWLDVYKYDKTRTASMKSPSFYLDDNHTKWHLDLLMGCEGFKYYYRIRLFAEFQGEKPQKKMKMVWSVVNDNTKSNSDERIIYTTINRPGDPYMDFPTLLGEIPTKLLSEETGHFDYDITIICHFYIVDDSFMSATNNPVPEITERNLPFDIAELFNNKEFTDITFILGDQRILAHKSILMARSPVFKAMFSHSMKEQNDNEVQIDDIDYEVFEEMLRYIYTDDVSNLKCPPKQLLYAADKYELKDLKKMCGGLLVKEITVDNAAETYIFADRHNLQQLSEQTRNFIRGHVEKFLNSPGYGHMVEKYPNLAIKVFKSPDPEA